MASTPRILIISSLIDPHADAVRWALGRQGIATDLWDLGAFPASSEMGLVMHEGSFGVQTRQGKSSADGPYDVVWMRRKEACKARPDTHRDDVRIVERESECFMANALDWLGHDKTLWVNHPHHEWRANLKAHQLLVAQKAGFKVPPTYMGNSPEAVRRLYAEQGEAIVYKPFRSGGWVNDNQTNTVLRTARLNASHLANDYAIAACPGIYQALVEKAFEVRATVFGGQIHSVKIDSQRNGATIDWRYDFRPGQEPIEAFDLPDEVGRCCLAVCEAFSLAFATFDLIVDKAGDYVFLEINPAGRFLFAEHHVPDVRLLDGFSRFLAGVSGWEGSSSSAALLGDYFGSPSYDALLVLQKAQLGSDT